MLILKLNADLIALSPSSSHDVTLARPESAHHYKLELDSLTGLHNDVYMFDLPQLEWTSLSTTGTRPSPRCIFQWGSTLQVKPLSSKLGCKMLGRAHGKMGNISQVEVIRVRVKAGLIRESGWQNVSRFWDVFWTRLRVWRYSSSRSWFCSRTVNVLHLTCFFTLRAAALYFPSALPGWGSVLSSPRLAPVSVAFLAAQKIYG